MDPKNPGEAAPRGGHEDPPSMGSQDTELKLKRQISALQRKIKQTQHQGKSAVVAKRRLLQLQQKLHSWQEPTSVDLLLPVHAVDGATPAVESVVEMSLDFAEDMSDERRQRFLADLRERLGAKAGSATELQRVIASIEGKAKDA